MATTTLQLVAVLQHLLRAANVPSAVTGEIGMSYHGVDVVVHDIELCVPAGLRALAVSAIKMHSALYESLPALTHPDFYHPYKKGAARFRVLEAEEAVELHIVTDDVLGLQLTASSVETGLCKSTASSEMVHLCKGCRDDMLQSIVWPTLATFTAGWLLLAERLQDSEESIIYMMQAERLLDANEVDDERCESVLGSPVSLRLARDLLAGKSHRKMMSTWD